MQLPAGFTMVAPSTTLPPVTAAHTSAQTHTSAQAHTPATNSNHKPTTGATKEVSKTASKTASTQPQKVTSSGGGRATGQATVPPSLFEVGSPQKVAALVLGSFIAILLLVGGIVFLGFAFVSSPSTAGGSRSVMEPYNQV